MSSNLLQCKLPDYTVQTLPELNVGVRAKQDASKFYDVSVTIASKLIDGLSVTVSATIVYTFQGFIYFVPTNLNVLPS